MTPEMRIVLNPKTGTVEKVQCLAPDARSQSEVFYTYQVLVDEINRFSERATKLLRLEKAFGRLN